jgi:hypothetical protein
MEKKDDTQDAEYNSRANYRLESWMGDLYPLIKHLAIGEMSLASAHNAGMDKKAPYSNNFITCQDDSFAYQLNQGIRVIDIRLKFFHSLTIPQELRFTHSLESGRKLGDLLDAVDDFQRMHPLEIVIFDFHEIVNNNNDHPYNFSWLHTFFTNNYKHKMLPFSAALLSLEDIRKEYPGPRIVVAVPSKVTAGRDGTYFWNQIGHKWAGAGQVSVDRLYQYIKLVMDGPPPQLPFFKDKLWSMSATGYGSAPLEIIDTLSGWYPTAGNWQLKSNIINFDWVGRKDARLIRQCIESNISKPVLKRLKITSPVEGETYVNGVSSMKGIKRGELSNVMFSVNGASAYTNIMPYDNATEWEKKQILPVGEISLRFAAKYKDYQYSVNTDPVTIRVMHAPPKILSPTDGSVVPTNRPTITGTAIPWSVIYFYEYGGNFTIYGRANVDGDGRFSVVSLYALPYMKDFLLTARQYIDDVPASDYATPIKITVKLPVVEIISPADGSVVASQTPLISGTNGVFEAKIYFYKVGSSFEYGTADVDQYGNWSAVPKVPLPPGSFSLICRQIYNGQESDSDAVTFFVDVQVQIPEITFPASGSTVKTNKPLITGKKGLEGARVHFYDAVSGAECGSAGVNMFGIWSDYPKVALPDGTFHLKCNQILNGAASDFSTTVTFAVDTSMLIPNTLSPANGATVTSSKPLIAGDNGIPKAIVSFYKAGSSFEYGTAEVNEVGLWSAAPKVALPDGSFTLICKQTSLGQESGESEPVTFTVKTLLATPRILSPVSGSTITTPMPVIIGDNGVRGGKIHFYQKGSDIEYGTADVNDERLWSAALKVSLPPGPFTLMCKQTLDGQESGDSEPVTFTIKPVSIPKILSPTNGSTVLTPLPVISGENGMKDGKIHFYQKGSDIEYGTADVNDEGLWSAALKVSLPPGPFTLMCKQTLDGQESGDSETVTFTVKPVSIPKILSPTDGSTVFTPLPVITGENGMKDGKIHLYRDGSDIELGTADVNDVGLWSGALKVSLPPGPFTLMCKQSVNGQQSGDSEPVTFTVDIGVLRPEILSPGNGSTVTTTMPLISGNNGIRGATIIYYKVNTPFLQYGSAIVGDGGLWSAPTVIHIPYGEFSLTCRQYLNGQESELAEAVTFTVVNPLDE